MRGSDMWKLRPPPAVSLAFLTIMFCFILLSCTHLTFVSRNSGEEIRPTNPALARLHMVEHFDYKQDKSLSSASIVSKNPKQYLR
jgi:hypothetical protein